MDLTEKRVMVIGGAGFIGSHLVDHLLMRPVAEVVVYDSLVRGSLRNLQPASHDPRLKVLDEQPDIRDRDQLTRTMENVDCVFNLAAIGIVASNESPDESFAINVEGNWNILRAASESGVCKIVHSSSASVYGQPTAVPMLEEHPYNNRTLYGATKVALEHLLVAMGELYSVDWVALRYFNVYGPRQDSKGAYTSVLHKILDRLDSGESPVIFGDGSQMLDFVHVSDVAEANIRAMEAEQAHGFVNVCSGVGTTIQEVVDTLMNLTDVHVQPTYKDPEMQASLVTKRIGGHERAQEQLGFSTRISLTDGLRSLIDWRTSSNN